jgi:hypothetical protein
MPPAAATGMPPRRGHTLFTDRVSDAVARLRPAVVVFDGTLPTTASRGYAMGPKSRCGYGRGADVALRQERSSLRKRPGSTKFWLRASLPKRQMSDIGRMRDRNTWLHESHR